MISYRSAYFVFLVVVQLWAHPLSCAHAFGMSKNNHPGSDDTLHSAWFSATASSLNPERGVPVESAYNLKTVSSAHHVAAEPTLPVRFRAIVTSTPAPALGESQLKDVSRFLQKEMLATRVIVSVAAKHVRARVAVIRGGFMSDCSDAGQGEYRAQLGAALGLSAADVLVLLCVVQQDEAFVQDPRGQAAPRGCGDAQGDTLPAALMLETSLRLPPTANESAVQAALAALPNGNTALHGLCVPCVSYMPPVSISLEIVLYSGAGGNAENADSPALPRLGGPGAAAAAAAAAGLRGAAVARTSGAVVHELAGELQHAIATSLGVPLDQDLNSREGDCALTFDPLDPAAEAQAQQVPSLEVPRNVASSSGPNTGPEPELLGNQEAAALTAAAASLINSTAGDSAAAAAAAAVSVSGDLPTTASKPPSYHQVVQPAALLLVPRMAISGPSLDGNEDGRRGGSDGGGGGSLDGPYPANPGGGGGGGDRSTSMTSQADESRSAAAGVVVVAAANSPRGADTASSPPPQGSPSAPSAPDRLSLAPLPYTDDVSAVSYGGVAAEMEDVDEEALSRVYQGDGTSGGADSSGTGGGDGGGGGGLLARVFSRKSRGPASGGALERLGRLAKAPSSRRTFSGAPMGPSAARYIIPGGDGGSGQSPSVSEETAAAAAAAAASTARRRRNPRRDRRGSPVSARIAPSVSTRSLQRRLGPHGGGIVQDAEELSMVAKKWRTPPPMARRKRFSDMGGVDSGAWGQRAAAVGGGVIGFPGEPPGGPLSRTTGQPLSPQVPTRKKPQLSSPRNHRAGLPTFAPSPLATPRTQAVLPSRDGSETSGIVMTTGATRNTLLIAGPALPSAAPPAVAVAAVAAVQTQVTHGSLSPSRGHVASGFVGEGKMDGQDAQERVPRLSGNLREWPSSPYSDTLAGGGGGGGRDALGRAASRAVSVNAIGSAAAAAAATPGSGGASTTATVTGRTIDRRTSGWMDMNVHVTLSASKSNTGSSSSTGAGSRTVQLREFENSSALIPRSDCPRRSFGNGEVSYNGGGDVSGPRAPGGAAAVGVSALTASALQGREALTSPSGFRTTRGSTAPGCSGSGRSPLSRCATADGSGLADMTAVAAAAAATAFTDDSQAARRRHMSSAPTAAAATTVGQDSNDSEAHRDRADGDRGVAVAVAEPTPAAALLAVYEVPSRDVTTLRAFDSDTMAGRREPLGDGLGIASGGPLKTESCFPGPMAPPSPGSTVAVATEVAAAGAAAAVRGSHIAFDVGPSGSSGPSTAQQRCGVAATAPVAAEEAEAELKPAMPAPPPTPAVPQIWAKRSSADVRMAEMLAAAAIFYGIDKYDCDEDEYDVGGGSSSRDCGAVAALDEGNGGGGGAVGPTTANDPPQSPVSRWALRKAAAVAAAVSSSEAAAAAAAADVASSSGPVGVPSWHINLASVSSLTRRRDTSADVCEARTAAEERDTGGDACIGGGGAVTISRERQQLHELQEQLRRLRSGRRDLNTPGGGGMAGAGRLSLRGRRTTDGAGDGWSARGRERRDGEDGAGGGGGGNEDVPYRVWRRTLSGVVGATELGGVGRGADSGIHGDGLLVVEEDSSEAAEA
ncbi:hypothetical protein VOLCADRAFT_108161 [Volvox carteri f. nagariensis]|uniref:Uncharacterized protein n=1 Tax=Volvox carteri f. nagariensis TaxID=3068 RepID=D8UIM7_VOLCA|nr:uncharacterized protein VOLCADRAFT_108161 [Volvox carteri f. nagariensis]EFJ40440.1 hypothetical protein VOLCADRAFT_108161 [Volvox carteri f. nagariensis]|eukprot:XP_002958520.1 hypothetical protein VOLCADRAFT_108161 [Volvox carteri f. nagariensis]